jgi:hypothetical protein
MNKSTVRADKIFHVLNLIKTPKYKLKTTGETRTHYDIVNAMLATIPEQVWIDGGTFMDPCFGRGTFLLKMIDKLSPYHTTEEIADMIYGVDIDSYCVQTTKDLIAKRLNIASDRLDNKLIKENFITWEPNKMSHKVIIGNPPFQEGGRDDEANKLWPHFVKKANELVEQDGYVAIITPTGWMQPTADIGKGTGTNALSIFNDIFKKNNLLEANVDSDKLQKTYFPGIGSTFSYFTFQKSAYSGNTKFVTPTGTINVDISTIDSLPKITSSHGLNIVKKMVGTAFLFCDQNHNLNGEEQEKQDATHTYKIYHTNKAGGTYWYGKVKNTHADSPKVIISLSGKYTAVFDNAHGFTNMCLAVVCKTSDEAKRAQFILSSNLYRFWVEMQKFSGFNPRKLILKLPALPLNVDWNNASIYQHFKLTDDEIAYVEGMFNVAKPE